MTDSSSSSSSSSSSKGAAQLDLLLLKAESYSKFILDNQERTQKMIASHQRHSSSTSAAPKAGEKKQRGRKRGKAAEQKGEDEEGSSKRIKVKTEVKTEEGVHGFAQPPNLTGGTLMPHQVEGMQWLLSLWENGLNGILADEMGLGKTIQIIALIAHLRHHNTAGPYLIAGPLATISNWVKEFQKWLPSCPVVLYHGDKAERERIRRSQLSVQRQKSLDFPVVVTSFEMCIIDRAFLEKYNWQYIILDEGHRIKNRNCKLLRELKSLRSTSRLLLTGTPIQNSLEELWSLLNFCSPMIFDDLRVFQSWFDFKNIGEETKVEDIIGEEESHRIVTKLHEILRPFVLRRLKKETLGDLVLPKKEIVVYCAMTRLQREMYAWVCEGTVRERLVALGVPFAQRTSQINATMNWRKVCNHPFLFGDVLLLDEDNNDDDNHPHSQHYLQSLVAASGKFKLLDRMLPRLVREGHKVILFSQMTELLNLLEDYLCGREISYVRLDGTTKLQERQERIDEFNCPAKGVSVFLISTRAGGLGINLTAADTVIIFDSDWNPHVDAQAQDRCHRIGQSKHVVIYRLLTPHSVEMEMMKKQLSKRKLERLAIQGGDFRKAGKRESRDFSLDDLRHLLADDVDLSRKTDGAGERESEESVLRDISDAELDLVMNRELLFGSGSGSGSGSGGDRTRSHSLTRTRSEKRASRSLARSRSGSECGSESVCGSASGSGSESEAEDFDGDLSVASQCAVPAEGEMYDIVHSEAAGMLSAIE